MDPVLLVIDIGILLYAVMLTYGVWKKRVYALRKWYEYYDNKKKYFEILIGYLIMLCALFVIRWSIVDRLYS
ncbi:hypothetical protein GZ78_11475 [Endozoicomonas numazuensis]|uniref:Uncharacterized protein n=1 Tax=Endozoicomonas numazuensis TaxID=1137799 RepID=A0A081NI93_9GAMM|nr:hypothetical protein GZ78_11475 [Endozoicomonas numazuensis]